MVASATDIYTAEYYARIAAVEGRHWWHVGMRDIAKAMLRRAGSDGFARVLDAGCGTGGVMSWAEQSLGARQVFGADIAEEALSFCVRSRRTVTRASVLQLPYMSDCFDLVICNDVIQHLPTDAGDRRGLAEMHRVLKPTGVLMLRTNSRQGMWHAAAAKDHDYQRYNLAEVSARLRAVGFNVVHATYANALAGAHDALRRLLRWSPPDHAHGHDAHQQHRVYEGLSIRDTATLHPWLNRLLLGALRAEASLVARGMRLPFGHSIVALARKSPVL